MVPRQDFVKRASAVGVKRRIDSAVTEYLKPFFKKDAVPVGLFDETGVAGAFEDLPAAVGDVLIERRSYHRGTDVAGAAAYQAGLLDLVESVGIFEILQVAERLVGLAVMALKFLLEFVSKRIILIFKSFPDCRFR